MAAAKITVSHKVSWVPGGGDSIVLNGTESTTQVGGDASERTQDVTSTTSALTIGACTGDKYFFVKNAEDPTGMDATALANSTIYVDIVTPVVPSTAQFKLPPGKSLAIFTAQDTWYGISASATVKAIVGAVER